MRGKTEACEPCTQKCIAMHKKTKAGSSTVTSFFKVMCGDHFSDILYLPPKFAPTVSALVNQETVLEDSGGQQWTVTISHVQGSYALDKGWSAFSADHKLEFGDFLVFNYIMGSRFYVQIYDRSGCEKLNFCVNHKKRKTLDISDNTFAEYGPSQKINKVSRTQRESTCEISQGQPPSAKEPFVEPYCMFNRDLGGCQEDGGRIFNLFDLEVQSAFNDCKKAYTGGDKMCPQPNPSMRSQTQTSLVNEDQVPVEKVSNVAPSDALRSIRVEKDAAVNSDKRYSAAMTSTTPPAKSPIEIGGKEMKSFDTLAAKTSTTSPEKSPTDIGGKGMHCSRATKTSQVPADRNKMNQKESSQLLHCKQVATPQEKNGSPDGHCQSVPPRVTQSNNKYQETSGMQNSQPGRMGKIIKEEAVQINSKPCRMKKIIKRESVQIKSETVGPSFTSMPPAVQVSHKVAAGRSQVSEKTNKTSKKDSSQLLGSKQVTLPKEKNVSPLGGSQSVPSKMTRSHTFQKISGVQNCQNGGIKKVIKDEPVQIISEPFGWKVKSEPVDPCFTSMPPAVQLSCKVAAGRQYFLELPICLPSTAQRGKRKERKRQVLLQDSSMRLWPVLYHEGYDFNILTSGWEAFSKANNIKPGNICSFKVASESEDIYQVIINKH